jgi:ATP-binding cassette subfamily B multidrug efflux pump
MEESLHQEEALGRAYDARLMRRLWPYLRPHRGLVWTSALLLLPLAFFHLLQPCLVKEAIDREIVPESGSLGGLVLWGGLLAAALVLESLLRYGQLYGTQLLGQRAMHALRVDAFGHLQTLEMRFFHRTPVGRILTRLTTDIEALNEMFASGVLSIAADLLTLGFIVVLLFSLSPRLAVTTLLVAPFVALLAWGFRRIAREAFRRIRERIARLNAYLAESITGMREIQMFTREDSSRREFEGLNAAHRAASQRSILADSMLFALVELLAAVAGAAVLWQGGMGIEEGTVTFGTLVAFLEYISKFFVPLRDLSAKYTVMQSGMAAAERILRLLDEPATLRSLAPPRAAAPGKGLALEHVFFAYPGGEPVIHDLSFCVAGGESVALVGATGAGKSTVVNLLLRFYEASAGRVSVGGVDVREQDPRALRRLFSVVQQDPFLFCGDLLSNITLGDPTIPLNRAREAAIAVGLGPLVSRLPEGWHSPVLERGANLSTGEKQLLALARALCRDPQVLILDEATSSVDAESEARIEQAKELLLRGRTSLVIAHRLTTVQRVRRILVLHRGRLVEEGSHEELLARGGRYARLYALQFMP